ncbi:hypothetical protein [Lyngbya sp. PCC 8106]|uniref:hypothetical protein n=1 Tax=Lyngbya sp. (strain PCC 8106) TaxID=313612 RepID=UPI0000EACEE8|nr:hypothetical protein [Lyngbya sp. PCC 8106]EAW36074.1 hypothetical protein L8106_19476 [Lyngbya sp. PCC 8106]
MTKQRSLGDMVKQEAQKVSDSDVQTVEAEIVNSAEVPEQEDTETSSTSEATETPTMRRKNPTKADLEVQITELTSQITELTSSLETSRENERTIQEKVLNLQSEVEEKSKFIAQLQKELKENDVKEELEKAQKAAFQLSETNSQLIEELEKLKNENQELKEKKEQKVKPDKKAHLPQLIHRPEHVTNQPKTSSNDDFSQSTWLL